MKTEAECAAIVLEWTTNGLVFAEREFQKAVCDEEARKKAEAEWNKMNPDDGVGCPSSNPYQLKDYEKNRLADLGENVENYRCVAAFVRKRVCAGYNVVGP